ncbi:hypothetical protein CRUP_009944 [Coryphaenoides rupestris]|nr:hypothetical protein CRUP_009944 [Coryphaenoides rupestris]
MPEFQKAFQVVFVDPSGHLNMCADMTACTYKQVATSVFGLLELVKLQASCKKLNLLSELMDHSGNYVHTALPYILSLLQQGLGQRIHLLSHSLSPDPEWSLEAEPPKHKAQPPLSFGLILRPEHAASVLERGPPADSPKAAAFRQLWGPRSELRRFQDGAITEAVLWAGESVCEKRLVPRQIVPSTGEEESLKLVQSYDDLSRKLWRLEGLPLSITSVQGSHPALRYTQVFPPEPLKLDYSFFTRVKSSRSLLPKEVVCHMEGSGKWPHDAVAIRHIKAAFHVKLGELLEKEHSYTCRPGPAHLDVWKAAQALELATVHGPLLTSTLHGVQQQHPCFGALPAAADYTDIKNDFVANRDSLPVMFIATPGDKKLSLWTRHAPSVQESFGELALFFCDPYGGTVIAVLWKPKAFKPVPFKTSEINARRVEVKGDEAHSVPNAEAIVEDFRVMGQGLVREVESRTERWSV